MSFRKARMAREPLYQLKGEHSMGTLLRGFCSRAVPNVSWECRPPILSAVRRGFAPPDSGAPPFDRSQELGHQLPRAAGRLAGPYPWMRTATLAASRSRLPRTSMVCAFFSLAWAILALIGPLVRSM